MFRVTFWLCESDPLRPVIVRVELPNEARLDLTVMVDFHDDPALAAEGENDALTRLGRPFTLSDTKLEKLLSGVIVTVYVVEP